MDTHALLHADLLDLIFDNRNKEYGAYQLRRNYSKHVMKSLGITSLLVTGIFSVVALTNPPQKSDKVDAPREQVTVVELPPDEPPKPKVVEPVAPRQTTAALTEALVPPIIVADTLLKIPMPEQADFTNATIDVKASTGDPSASGTQDVSGGTIDQPAPELLPSETIEQSVDIMAAFDGNWTKFLLRNLNANTPVDNGAPAGMYKVVIQFVVDIDGAVSNIKALTSHGFGLEEEAMRVIKKSKNWEPGIKKGVKVKSYRRQPIIFEVASE